MEIVKICAVGIISAFCILILKESKSEMALIVAIVGGCIIILMLLEYILDIFTFIKTISEKAGIDNGILTLLFKIVGVAYLAEFSASIIEESGSKSLAEKVILGGKILIVVLSIPIVQALFELIAGILG